MFVHSYRGCPLIVTAQSVSFRRPVEFDSVSAYPCGGVYGLVSVLVEVCISNSIRSLRSYNDVVIAPNVVIYTQIFPLTIQFTQCDAVQCGMKARTHHTAWHWLSG